jgi:foldase protein PrsA
MSQSRKRGANQRSIEMASSSKNIDRVRRRRWTAIIIASVVIVLIAVIVVVSLSLVGGPLRRTIIVVDDTSIRMDYFLKRARLAGADPIGMLESLTNEQIIKLGAPQYAGQVYPEDIDQELRRIAGGEDETITESEFKEWYRQQLNETGLSDAEYRDITATAILTNRLHEYLAVRVPTIARQVHLYAIVLQTYEDAEEVRARWEAGEDFADLAQEVSLDEAAKENGGEIGWFPAGVLDTTFDYVAFTLSAGDVSQPVAYAPDPSATEQLIYYLFWVSEIADAREVDEDSMGVLRSRVLEFWLATEIQLHEISYHGLTNGFDSETNAWINWQLSRQ